MACLAIMLPLCATTARAQNTRCESARRVVDVDFAGSPRFGHDTLAASIVTQGGSFWKRLFRIGELPCADTLEVRRDALRIAVLHRQAGWFSASVTPRYLPSERGVRILFDIVPGPEATLDTLRIVGLPPAAEGRRPFDAPLRELQGKIFDRVRLLNTVETVLVRLREAGYARAVRGENRIVIDTAKASVSMDLAFVPGRRVTLGEVSVEVQGIGDDRPTIDSADVMRLVGVRAGQRYRASTILDAQRDLYRSEAFHFVLIDTQPPKPGQPDSVLNLRVSVAEARTRYARAGLGWATQDCIRVQGRVADRSFLGVGRRAELNVRMSKLGRAKPADFAPGLCSGAVRGDTLASSRVNYFTGLSFSDTRLFGWDVAPVLTVYSERRGEPSAYLRETQFGMTLELTRQLSPRTVGTGGLQYENGRTFNDPVVSCSRFAQCRPDDYALSKFGRGLGIASTSVAHDRTNDLVNPSRGVRARGEVRVGETFSEIVRSVVFYRTTGEGTFYRPVLGGVLATRLQLSRAFAPGAALAGNAPLLPQQERLYAGGQNSVRGFQQNLLGPIIYVVYLETDVKVVDRPTGERVYEVVSDMVDYRAAPRGGTALVVANVEYRRSLPWLSNTLQLAAFVDAGNVWETQSGGFHRGDMRATPGLGVRLSTPLGPFRLDVGYQPYPPRAGRALYFTSGPNGAIFCASPGNTVAINRVGESDIFNCPETYRPRAKGVLSRLVFHFGLGQAF
jgi:outer membrane protein insertion porin family/translocation and assembly module TamA